MAQQFCAGEHGEFVGVGVQEVEEELEGYEAVVDEGGAGAAITVEGVQLYQKWVFIRRYLMPAAVRQ